MGLKVPSFYLKLGLSGTSPMPKLCGDPPNYLIRIKDTPVICDSGNSKDFRRSVGRNGDKDQISFYETTINKNN